MRSIADSIREHPDHAPALEFDDHSVSYGELSALAGAVSRAVDRRAGGPLGLAAFLASKGPLAYAAIVGIHGAGRGYVPLQPTFPPARLAGQLERSGSEVLIVGDGCLARALEVLRSIERPLDVVCESAADLEAAGGAPGPHHFEALGSHGPYTPRPTPPDAVAYLLFTSGSTGTPKGVPVTFGNLEGYLGNVERLFPLTAEDRCSQTFDLTFDLSVHDVFATFRAGACLCPLRPADLLGPARFARRRRLTVWFSVPALAMVMDRMRTLRPGVLPDLRTSLFCGEALPVQTAAAWAAAAPNSRLFNLYGPTEATIAITAHEWTAADADAARNGLVPIGTPFDGQRAVLLDGEGRIVDGPGRGELALAGSQVTTGYLDAPDRTAASYVRLGGSGALHYRTGDLVERDEQGVLHYVARVDNQIKLRGWRIELHEIDGALRLATGSDLSVAVPLPNAEAPEEIVGVVVGAGLRESDVLARCAETLPDYMVPSRLLQVSDLPTNSNGKIDRRALAALLSTR